MKITFEIPADLEARLRERAEASDTEAMRLIMAEAVMPIVEAMLREPDRFVKRADGLTDVEYDALLEELDRLPPPPHSPNIAFTREEIYDDHL